MKLLLPIAIAITLGLLAVAPPLPYAIPVEINSFAWVYLVVASALLGFFLMFREKDLQFTIRLFMMYLFFNCFVSQVPFLSFNAYVVVVITTLFFLACKSCDNDILLDVLQAVFWLQVSLMAIQHVEMDTLMSFGMPDKTLAFGTVFQSMRLGSMFAIMAPFLLLKSKWYIVPLSIIGFLTWTLNLSFSLAVGILVWSLLSVNGWKNKVYIISGTLLFCVVCAMTNNHIHIEIIEGRWPMAWLILKTWMFDTSVNFHGFHSGLNPAIQSGPFDITRFLFGHGMGTFDTLIPFYKYDPNAFRPAHNDYLQILWDLGWIGFWTMIAYIGNLVARMFKCKMHNEICGTSIIATNMLLAFPVCMTQTVFLIVAWCAHCERKICSNSIS